MHDDQVAIRIVVVEVLRERLALRVGVGVLLAEVPVQCQVMSEARDQFAIVQLPLIAQRAAVQVLVVLLLLRLEVEVNAHPIKLAEHDLPLVQL
jgi:hypothetical protein